MVKDKPYKYGAASSMGTQEEYFKNIKTKHKFKINAWAAWDTKCAPPSPPTIELKYF